MQPAGCDPFAYYAASCAEWPGGDHVASNDVAERSKLRLVQVSGEPFVERTKPRARAIVWWATALLDFGQNGLDGSFALPSAPIAKLCDLLPFTLGGRMAFRNDGKHHRPAKKFAECCCGVEVELVKPCAVVLTGQSAFDPVAESEGFELDRVKVAGHDLVQMQTQLCCEVVSVQTVGLGPKRKQKKIVSRAGPEKRHLPASTECHRIL